MGKLLARLFLKIKYKSLEIKLSETALGSIPSTKGGKKGVWIQKPKPFKAMVKSAQRGPRQLRGVSGSPLLQTPHSLPMEVRARHLAIVTIPVVLNKAQHLGKTDTGEIMTPGTFGKAVCAWRGSCEV